MSAPASDIDHPDRRLPFEGTANFRDLGGYEAADGRAVQWRRVFRSG
ncbi:MAG: tyrosine-protein phosphatase, partial [Sphingomonadales bacterium]|nr:tyrosine-protein phosphatase [Sphingomonadales bacterium]